MECTLKSQGRNRLLLYFLLKTLKPVAKGLWANPQQLSGGRLSHKTDRDGASL